MGFSNRVEEMFTIKKMEPIMIRPARKTPKGNYFLSNMEQNLYYDSEFIFSFEAGNGGKRSTDTVYEVMKGSLAEALVHFYPLAGRVIMDADEKFVVDCTGEGVPFVEAQVETKMDLLGDILFIGSAMLPQLIYSPEGAITVFDKPLLTVQVTRFECGGFVLGVSICNLLCDGNSFGEFIVSWSEIARGLPLTSPPFLDRSILRARQPPKIEFLHHEFSRKKGRDVMWMTKEMSLTPPLMAVWSFCFNPKLLTQMKSHLIMNDPSIRFPTTFELVTALVWRNRTIALKIEPSRKVRMMICVDLRKKIGGMLPKGYFGIGVSNIMCYCDAGDLVQKPLSFAIKLIQDTISSVTKAYVQSFIDCFEATRSDIEFENTCSITKLHRLPFYESDFGWGYPTQVAPAASLHEEIYYLSQGKDSENIVLFLSLPAFAMKIFQELMQSEFKQDHVHLPGIDTPRPRL